MVERQTIPKPETLYRSDIIYTPLAWEAVIDLSPGTYLRFKTGERRQWVFQCTESQEDAKTGRGELYLFSDEENHRGWYGANVTVSLRGVNAPLDQVDTPYVEFTIAGADGSTTRIRPPIISADKGFDEHLAAEYSRHKERHELLAPFVSSEAQAALEALRGMPDIAGSAAVSATIAGLLDELRIER